MRTPMEDRQEGRAEAGLDPARLADGFERRVSELTAAARRVRAAADPEAIHDLRVAIRRLIAALRLWRHLLPSRARRVARRRLRRLRRRLGRARELEVHVELLEERLPRPGAARGSAAGATLGRLRARLARRRRTAARRVAPRRLGRLLRPLAAVGHGLRARGDDPVAAPDVLAFERRLGGRAFEALRIAAEHPDDGSLHEARLRVKKWRYVLECVAESVPGVAWPAVRPLRRLQGLLGDAHDRALLRDRLARAVPDGGASGGDDALNAVMDRLAREQERAVRRFRRIAAALVAGARGGAAGAAGRGGIVPAAAAPAARAAAAGAPEGPRDTRWERMASWLAEARRRR